MRLFVHGWKELQERLNIKMWRWRADGRDQKSEVRGQRSEVRGLTSEARGQKSEDGDLKEK